MPIPTLNLNVLVLPLPNLKRLMERWLSIEKRWVTFVEKLQFFAVKFC